MLVKKGIRIESKNSRVYNAEIAISCWRKGIPSEKGKSSPRLKTLVLFKAYAIPEGKSGRFRTTHPLHQIGKNAVLRPAEERVLHFQKLVEELRGI